MEVKAYVKKQIPIQCVQWDGTALAASPIIDGILGGGGAARYVHTGEDHPARHSDERDDEGRALPNAPGFIVVDTLEGAMRADPHDWIARGIHGEYYPIKPDIFEETYDECGWTVELGGETFTQAQWERIILPLQQNQQRLWDAVRAVGGIIDPLVARADAMVVEPATPGDGGL